jgi:hypothetical protein
MGPAAGARGQRDLARVHGGCASPDSRRWRRPRASNGAATAQDEPSWASAGAAASSRAATVATAASTVARRGDAITTPATSSSTSRVGMGGGAGAQGWHTRGSGGRGPSQGKGGRQQTSRGIAKALAAATGSRTPPQGSRSAARPRARGRAHTQPVAGRRGRQITRPRGVLLGGSASPTCVQRGGRCCPSLGRGRRIAALTMFSPAWLFLVAFFVVQHWQECLPIELKSPPPSQGPPRLIQRL